VGGGGAQRDAEVRYLGALSVSAARMGIAGRVRFLGERTDTSALYAAADLYCQPNTQPDSYGLTFVEALSAGLPVITSAIGGATEIVDASCGVLVPPGDPAALAAGSGAWSTTRGRGDRSAPRDRRGPARSVIPPPDRRAGPQLGTWLGT